MRRVHVTMNCVYPWLFTLALLCLTQDATTRPSPTQADVLEPTPTDLQLEESDQPQERQSDLERSDLSRRMRSGRKLRLLRKVLRRLSHTEVMALVRSKKGGRGPYDFYDPYGPTRSSRPRMPVVGKLCFFFFVSI